MIFVNDENWDGDEEDWYDDGPDPEDNPFYKKVKEKAEVAFESLSKDGYFCRSHWQCCQNCGCAAIPKDNQGKYIFWHMQDTDNCQGCGGYLYLAWDGDGDKIVAALKDAGLKVNWDGSEYARIQIGESCMKSV